MMNIDKQKLGRIILEKLTSTFRIKKGDFVVDYAENPFEILVSIILSQNTSDKNSIRAFLNLKNSVSTTPEKLAKASLEEIEKAIKVGGLYKIKARRIKGLANMILKGLNLKEILEMPVELAREKLLKIPGIGRKTADVFLALFGKKTIGVDTHAARVAKRLGLVSDDANYEEIRHALLETFNFVENFDYVHRLLIQLGRTFCKAKSPKCRECPLRDYCLYARRFSPKMEQTRK